MIRSIVLCVMTLNILHCDACFDGLRDWWKNEEPATCTREECVSLLGSSCEDTCRPELPNQTGSKSVRKSIHELLKRNSGTWEEIFRNDRRARDSILSWFKDVAKSKFVKNGPRRFALHELAASLKDSKGHDFYTVLSDSHSRRRAHSVTRSPAERLDKPTRPRSKSDSDLHNKAQETISDMQSYLGKICSKYAGTVIDTTVKYFDLLNTPAGLCSQIVLWICLDKIMAKVFARLCLTKSVAALKKIFDQFDPNIIGGAVITMAARSAGNSAVTSCMESCLASKPLDTPPQPEDLSGGWNAAVAKGHDPEDIASAMN